MKERDIEKRVCKIVWETFHKVFDDVKSRWDAFSDGLDALDRLKDELEEVLPYGPEEVH